MESEITHGEILVVMDSKNVYHKRDNSTRDINVFKNHLAEATEAGVNKADHTTDADNVKHGVYEKYHSSIRKMLRKHNDLCSG